MVTVEEISKHQCTRTECKIFNERKNILKTNRGLTIFGNILIRTANFFGMPPEVIFCPLQHLNLIFLPIL